MSWRLYCSPPWLRPFLQWEETHPSPVRRGQKENVKLLYPVGKREGACSWTRQSMNRDCHHSWVNPCVPMSHVGRGILRHSNATNGLIFYFIIDINFNDRFLRIVMPMRLGNYLTTTMRIRAWTFVTSYSSRLGILEDFQTLLSRVLLKLELNFLWPLEKRLSIDILYVESAIASLYYQN